MTEKHVTNQFEQDKAMYNKRNKKTIDSEDERTTEVIDLVTGQDDLKEITYEELKEPNDNRRRRS